MPSFLTYETNQVIINDNLFPANSVNLQLNASTVPVKDILGNILYYSPTEPIKGSFSVNFFLTGALPSYLRLENQTEISTKFAFNRILIPDCHLTNLSFAVRPFEPIPVKADFVFYHGIISLNTEPTIINSQSQKLFSKYVNYVNQSFATGLNILNGMSSYILTDNRSTWTENQTDFVVTDFDYQFSVERVPILRVGEQFPQRVAMKEINAEFNITTNNLDGVLDIHGNSAVFEATLRDNTNSNIYTNFNLTGIITDQSYEIGEDNYGFSKIKMMQSLNRKRNIVTIPMEVSDPLIVNSPTTNPGITTTVTNDKPVEEEKKPDVPGIPDEPIKGENTPPTPISPSTWYYFSVKTGGTIFNYKNGQPNKMTTFAYWRYPSIMINENNSYENMRFEIIDPSFDNSLTSKGTSQNGANYIFSQDVIIATFKVSKEFLDNFKSSNFYNSKLLDLPFMIYTCKADKTAILENGTEPNTVEVSMYQFFYNFAATDENKSPGTPAIIDLSSIAVNIIDSPLKNDGRLYISYKP